MGLSFNPLAAASQIALGVATGGTSLLVSQIVKAVVSQIAQQIIQKLGDQMGLPQGVIDMAQATVAGGLGDIQGARQNYAEAGQSLAQDFFPNASASDRGAIAQSEDTLHQSIADYVAATGASGADEDGNPRGLAAGRSGGGGQSWLMALAKALGSQLNEAQNQLEQTMDGTNWKKADQVAEFQAQSQQFALFMNTATNVIKTVGESLSTMARKQ